MQEQRQRVLEIQVEVSSEGRPGTEEASALLDSLIYRIRLLAREEGREPSLEYSISGSTIELRVDGWTEKAALASLYRLEEMGRVRILSIEGGG